MAISPQRRLLWQPQNLNSTETDRFRRFINKRHNLSIRDYGELHAYSVSKESAGDFWVDLFLFLDIKADVIPRSSYLGHLPMYSPPQFFPGIKSNFAANLLLGNNPKDIAIHACNEGGINLIHVTWGELYRRVEQTADAMAAFGIGVGDRVAAVISNRPETMILCLATLSLGALWSTSSPDMGDQGILDRLLQIRPKLVFAESAVLYNGKIRKLMEKHSACASRMQTTPEFITYVVIEHPDQPVKILQGSGLIGYPEFLQRRVGRKLSFEQLPFHHPGFIVYSSGTTGQPKCIVHSAMGLLLQVRKDSTFCFDVRPGDTLLQYTTTGWIMWAMVLCGLAYKGRVVVYDGSPLLPDKLVLFRLVEKLKVKLLGTSARFLSDLKAENLKPKNHCDLSSLRTITSTGSTLAADVCNWFYDEGFPAHIHLASTSGGTDLACSLVSGTPTLPVYSGEIQCESLGMAVDIADVTKAELHSIKSSGKPGELVCTMPFPSQPVMFWGSTGAKRYESSYFERFGRKVWNQGDFVQMSTDTGGFLMLGRSDGVLNPSGVRFGSAEIYEVVDKLPYAEDTICVGQRRARDADESVILFVKMQQNKPLTTAMKKEIQSAIRTARSPRHVPKYIFQVPEIPYTINGKKVEIAVKQIVCGTSITPSSTVANPQSLKFFEQFLEVEQAARGSESPSAKL
ncbi:acetoacetate-CoA ligase [Cladophialophora psammophila CBS 110553]|uniref:Acetoacetate-CoA ligase n=1 Tax=Cladophialophora psammophila CBS 110553 TaxID=1182543 RepID=W9WV94_9EURO|nr:acetoacetate-CoA ligase [Cladophialophora psammophila CBS 110553]EXJ71833.1 acetoacetate-CoA ligase [Cladophialophora psammophila CBS 110553]